MFSVEDPTGLARFGFKFSKGGVHAARTMMLAELQRLLKVLPEAAQRATTMCSTSRRSTRASSHSGLFLAYLDGRLAQRLFSSDWLRVLDLPEEQLIELTQTTAQRGLFVFHRIGGVMEVRFPGYLSKQECTPFISTRPAPASHPSIPQAAISPPRRPMPMVIWSKMDPISVTCPTSTSPKTATITTRSLRARPDRASPLH